MGFIEFIGFRVYRVTPPQALSANPKRTMNHSGGEGKPQTRKPTTNRRGNQKPYITLNPEP